MTDKEKELAVVVGYIMYNDLLADTQFDGSFFYKIDNVIKLAEEFLKLYPHETKWGLEKEWDETLELWVSDNIEKILK